MGSGGAGRVTSSAEGETKGEFLWDVWVGGGDFNVLLLNAEFIISPLVWILALLLLKIPMAFFTLSDRQSLGWGWKKKSVNDGGGGGVCADSMLQMQVGCLDL